MSGFGGMRDYNGLLSFDPRLPADWPELAFPLQWHGTQLDITLTRDALRVAVREGDPVTFTVRGEEFTAAAGADAVAALADQGPVLEGRPTMQKFADARRDDGTLMAPSVPVTTSAIPVVDIED